jgi:hypothetical protein
MYGKGPKCGTIALSCLQFFHRYGKSNYSNVIKIIRLGTKKKSDRFILGNHRFTFGSLTMTYACIPWVSALSIWYHTSCGEPQDLHTNLKFRNETFPFLFSLYLNLPRNTFCVAQYEMHQSSFARRDMFTF